jgi:LPXTG-motif cell wall-anchored protein
MFILGAVALMVLAPAAHAQYGGTPGATVSDSTVSSGDTVTVSATCEVPAGTDVTFFLDGTAVGSGVTDDSGTASADITVTGSPGTHQITNSCNSAVISITIAGGTAGALPRTGTDSSLPLAKIAIVLIAAGGLLIIAARKKSVTA